MAVPTIDAFSFFAAYNELELLVRLRPASSVVPSLRITDLCLVNSKLAVFCNVAAILPKAVSVTQPASFLHKIPRKVLAARILPRKKLYV